MMNLDRADREALAGVIPELEKNGQADVYWEREGVYRGYVDVIRHTIQKSGITESKAYSEFAEQLRHPIEGWLPPKPEGIVQMSDEEIAIRLAHHFKHESSYRGNLNTPGKFGGLLEAVRRLAKVESD